MNKIITQRKMRLTSLNQTSELSSHSDKKSTEELEIPSERVIQNILNYAKSLEVLKLKNSFEFVLMN